MSFQEKAELKKGKNTKSVLADNFFTEEKLEKLSSIKNEPEWIKQLRFSAWEVYRKLPFPQKTDEDWRRTDLSVLNLEKAVTGLVQDRKISLGFSSLDLNKNLVRLLSEKKIIFTSLDEAIVKYPDLVKEYFQSKCINPEEGKFQALNAAFWTEGVFLAVPENVQVEIPLYTFFELKNFSGGIFPHTVIVVQKGGKLVLVQEYSSDNIDSYLFASTTTEIYLERNSHLIFAQIQKWGPAVIDFSFSKAVLERDSQLISLTVSLGARLSRNEVHSKLIGQGATSLMFGLAVGNEKQHFEQHTLQEHQAPQTTSDLLFKTALLNQAYSVFSGLIRVRKDAQRTDAYQANRNLLLSSQAKADTLPKLEILANDVRCTHGATVGPVDAEQCFYLMSRGIPEEEAEKIVVEGFFDEVLKRIPETLVKEKVSAYIDRKLQEKWRSSK